MASFSQIPREEKRRIAGELHDNLTNRKASGAPDALLDPFIPKFAASRDQLGVHVEGKTQAEAQRAALLAAADIDDDEVDRWYRHIYRYNEVESLRRHAPEHAAIDALLSAGYPEGLAHIDARIPDQNDEVRKTIAVYRDPQHAGTVAAMQLPSTWLDSLEAALKKSDVSFAAYQATFGDASSAVAMGRDAEGDWVVLVRALDNAVKLRGAGAEISVVEEGKQLIAPLTNAIRLLRSESRTRATKRKKESEGAGGSPT